MNRRGFVKGVLGLVAGGVGALFRRDHIREVTKKVKTPWQQTIGTTYEATNLNADMADGTPMLHVTKYGVYLDGRRLPQERYTIKRRTATITDEWA